MHTKHGGTTAGFSTAGELALDRTCVPTKSVPTLTILGHPDLERVGERVILGELLAGREVSLARHAPRFKAPGAYGGQPLDDRFLSRQPIHLRADGTGGVHVLALTSRTHLTVDGEEVGERAHLSAEQLERGALLALAHRVVLLLHLHLVRSEQTQAERHGLVGDSAGMESVREQIAQVAEWSVPVLIRGETGTGKELVAKALHASSSRHRGPFVSVNLAALATSLAPSELFGARKGAFTGAVRDQQGLFVAADGGTLFLDEVGEAPAEVQAMLLRTLETGEVCAVGSQRPRRVDVRVLSATDADLEGMVEQGRFRAPLLHRLEGYSICMPPLRERRDDIGRLLVHMLRRELAVSGQSWPPSEPGARQPWLSAGLVAELSSAAWPGNVRQFQNVVRRLVIDHHSQPTLDAALTAGTLSATSASESVSDLGAAGLADAEATPAELKVRMPSPERSRRTVRHRRPSEVSEEELVAALREHAWNRKAAAAALGVSRTSLYTLLERSPRVRSAVDIPPQEIHEAWREHHGNLRRMVETLEISDRALRQRLKDLGLRPERENSMQRSAP